MYLPMEARDYLSIPKIDIHAHIPADHVESLDFLEALGVKLMNISIGTDTEGKWRAAENVWGTAPFVRMAKEWPERCAWCTAFDLPRLDDKGYIDAVIAGLKKDFAAGAVACKVWKNIGLEVKKPDGSFLQVDDPFLKPIFDYLESDNRVLIIHAGAQKKTAPGDSGDPKLPPHEAGIAARDRVIERHPKMTVVGCHLGSQAYDLKEVAKTLDRYPNYVVDTAARVMNMAKMDPGEVRQFLDKYHDQLLWGSDFFSDTNHSALSSWGRVKELGYLRYRYLEEFTYFSSKEEILLQEWQLTPHRCRGLGLNPDLLDRIYRLNAVKWIPGLARLTSEA